MNRPLSLNGLYFGISIEDQMDKMSVPQVQVIADTLSITPGDGIRRRVLGALVKNGFAERFTDANQEQVTLLVPQPAADGGATQEQVAPSAADDGQPVDGAPRPNPPVSTSTSGEASPAMRISDLRATLFGSGVDDTGDASSSCSGITEGAVVNGSVNSHLEDHQKFEIRQVMRQLSVVRDSCVHNPVSSEDNVAEPGQAAGLLEAALRVDEVGASLLNPRDGVLSLLQLVNPGIKRSSFSNVALTEDQERQLQAAIASRNPPSPSILSSDVYETALVVWNDLNMLVLRKFALMGNGLPDSIRQCISRIQEGNVVPIAEAPTGTMPGVAQLLMFVRTFVPRKLTGKKEVVQALWSARHSPPAKGCPTMESSYRHYLNEVTTAYHAAELLGLAAGIHATIFVDSVAFLRRLTSCNLPGSSELTSILDTFLVLQKQPGKTINEYDNDDVTKAMFELISSAEIATVEKDHNAVALASAQAEVMRLKGQAPATKQDLRTSTTKPDVRAAAAPSGTSAATSSVNRRQHGLEGATRREVISLGHCFWCGSPNHMVQKCKAQEQACAFCAKPGHPAASCPEREDILAAAKNV